jgi:hypothetical protein
MSTPTSETTTTAPRARVSPMRMIGQMLFRMRARGQDGLELDLIAQQVDREQTAVAQVLREARANETTWERLRRLVYEFLHDKKTPGVIDAQESRQLSAEMLNASLAATTHTQTVEALT